MKRTTVAIMAASVAVFILASQTGATASPTDGFVQYSSSYKVQNWTSGCGGFSDLGGGEFETWVCAGESRVEMRWDNWPNQNTANQFECDAMFDGNSQNTAIHQIKSNTGGEVIYLQIQSPGTLRNDNGSVFATGMANQWFHINSIFNPVTGNGLAYINGALKVTRSYPTSDRAWYFKNGCYNNGLPTGGKSTAWFKNIVTWVQSSSPDFSLAATPSSQTVVAGNNTTYTASISALNGFSSSVSFTVSGLPAGATGTFNPTSVTGAGSSTLTVATTTGTAPGTYTLTVTGASGSLTHSATVSLVVTAPPDFSLSASPASQTVTAGNGTSYTATVSALNGFSGSVSFSVSGLPSGASGSFNPASVAGAGSSTLTVTTTAGTAAGSYPVTITGTSGSLSHNAAVTLVVTSVSTNTSYEAESLAYTTNGAAAALQTDANSSGGEWIALEATQTGPYIQFTLPNVPAGTYQLQMMWKGNTSRGILSLSVDGATLGSNLDQYSATQTYPTTTFGTVTLGAGNHTVRLTVTGKNASSSSDWLSADKFILVPVVQTLNFEAESLAYTTNGAAAALQTDSNSSGGEWIALEATATGPYIEFTLPNVPAGTYQLQMEWKGNNSRGILSLSVDGATLGSNLDQYSATQTYPTTTFGNVTLGAGNHLVRLTVVGKNASSSNYWLSADKFTLVPQ